MTWPEPTLLSIYKACPRRTGRAAALKAIAGALDRIVACEIDGQPRTPEEAVAFLRQRTDAFCAEMAGREPKFISHPSTFFNQPQRYLRTGAPEPLPRRLDVCCTILALYPKMPAREYIERNVSAFLPHLNAIDKIVAGQPAKFVEYLAERTALYACHVSRWPEDEIRFIPGAKRWFGEHRFEQSERQWHRSGPVDYEQERDQLRRLSSS